MRSKAEEKLRAKGEIGDRFKDHGSMQVLEEVLGESKDICRQNDAHQAVRQLRLDTVSVRSGHKIISCVLHHERHADFCAHSR